MFEGFLYSALISLFAVLVSWLFNYEILSAVWNVLPKLPIRPRLRVMIISVPIFASHIFSIWFYGLIYFIVENYTNLGQVVGEAKNHGLTWVSFLDCLYFSATTYTSLGTGDFVATSHLRMIGSTEVLNGLVLIGWTISFTFMTMDKFWSGKN